MLGICGSVWRDEMQRKKFDAATKARVALEAAKGLKTANEIAAQYDCHPTQVSQWKKELLEGVLALFENPEDRERRPALKLSTKRP
jgi:transposase-like protein